MNGKRRVFIEEYLKCWNATEAARRADYAYPNTQGPRMLVDVGIKAEIDRRISEIAMDADEVLTRWANQARGNIGPYLDFLDTGDFDDLKDTNLDLIKKAKVNKKGEVTLELYDAQTALAQLGKNLGLADKTITLKLEKEVDGILSILAEALSDKDYERVLAALDKEDS